MKKLVESKWLFACVLSTPMVAYFAWYLINHSSGLIPTGFIQYDNVSYVAFGKQYLDTDKFHLTYSNPFNESDQHTPIYFQTQFLFFAFLMKLGIPVGWILIPFTIICTIICFRIVISIYDHLVKKSRFRSLHIWLFCWGGGLLTICGYILQYFLPPNGQNAFDNSFILDPTNGWWGLNLGRSLFFSCEAYYHVLFFGCIYFLLTRKWLQAFVMLTLLSLSHPFSGIELIGITSAWIGIEIIINRKCIPLLFLAGTGIIGLFHIYYYLFYLNKFPEHHSVNDQYSLVWTLRYYNMIPAYCISGLLAIMAICKNGIKKFFTKRENRLFGCWFLVAILFANHELFIGSRQPIHFARGYIWSSLFLMGLPALKALSEQMNKRLGKFAIILFTILFFSDNFLWILNISYVRETQPSTSYITKEQQSLFHTLNKETDQHTLIISNDRNVSYLSTVYTKAYPWISHVFTTPFSIKKGAVLDSFIIRGKIDDTWQGRNVVFVFSKPVPSEAVKAVEKAKITDRKETENYVMIKCDSLYLY